MPQSADDRQLAERIERDFTYHPPDGAQMQLYAQIRILAKDFAKHLAQTCPEGREKSLALTRLDEAVMWANAAIARSGP
jgi:hypothetical protein